LLFVVKVFDRTGKYILETTAGKDLANNAPMQVAKQHSIDNMPYLEAALGVKAIRQSNLIEAENDFRMHIVVFDRVLTE
jgi:hypothetical protein